ncbi:esterase-like activity of phytase family protein [Palleronia sp. LCG004]|uniref:esterase-like activity of phytase family protein n=1 Tax=Palleronia sp. LCG004 TaxID=3079304 RepID=UPI002942EFC6|nr:esterase-like activity of phytase family protein [Palleronia sp. LCG004]WOI56061.1 esterase-like activity of phytase family protein [Palleronia sp. LCG004]
MNLRFALLFAAAPSALAAQDVPEMTATLAAHAMLPAQSFVAAPDDAPAMFNMSGRFTGDGRTEDLYAIHDDATGLSRPFPGQPLQGFSGIRSLGGDRFLVLTDNGFGSKSNSADALLMFHELRIDWTAGRVIPSRTTFLSDPNRIVPFPIVNEATATRYLTGADFDLESIQPVGEGYWIGDEFGPWLIEVDGDGVVRQVVATEPEGEIIRSPDNAVVATPNPGGTLEPEVRAMRSGGYEGMALSEDGRTLYPLLEKPLWDPDAGEAMRIEGTPVLPMFELNTDTSEWGDRTLYYPLEDAGHAIGDFNLIGGTRGLIIERDNGQGAPDFSETPAEFKRIYLVDLSRSDGNGVLEKIAYIDLMRIKDPDGIAQRGTGDGTFTFPFVTIENVDRVDETTIVVANDNNYPFSVGREAGRADDNEFILLDVAEFLTAE